MKQEINCHFGRIKKFYDNTVFSNDSTDNKITEDKASLKLKKEEEKHDENQEDVDKRHRIEEITKERYK